MTNNEQIDAYFNGTLNEAEKQDFIKKLDSNSDLKSEFNFQSDIVAGLHSARKAELIARLDAVTVGGGSTSIATIGKAALIAAVLSSGALIYWNASEEKPTSETVAPRVVEEKIEDLIPTLIEPEVEEEVAEDITKKEDDQLELIADANDERITPKKPEINKPNIVEPLELTTENYEDEMPESFENEDPTELSNIDVEIDNSKRKYSFHYQFKDGKLFLFGSFDKGLYEIIEINSSNDKALYLFYKESYYTLNKSKSDITELSELNDTSLLTRLEKIRER